MTIDNFAALSRYLENMNAMYRWPEDEWNKVKEGLLQLKNRAGDKNLYMGIVGEFSAGKSTFINALLGIDLLKEDILQGTTCAPTLLRYGKQFDVEIYKTDSNKVIRFSKKMGMKKKIGNFLKRLFHGNSNIQEQFSDAKDFIEKYTADEDFAKDVREVIIYLPIDNPIFQNDIVIVDTPGVNADNARHQEVTEKTVRNLCDLAIVLTPAPAPCSRTLVSFIHDHLEEYQQYCICIASQIDRVRKAERTRQVKYISDRFQTEGICFLKTYPLSATSVIHPEEILNSDEVKPLQDEFIKTMTFVYEDLKSNRDNVLQHKLQVLLKDIINSMLEPMLQKTTNEVRIRYEELQRNQLSDFDEFIRKEKKMMTDKFNRSKISQYEINDIAGNAKRLFVDKVFSRISNVSSKKELKEVMSKYSIESMIQSIQDSYVQKQIATLQKRVSSRGTELFSEFKGEFNTHFRNLGHYIQSSSVNIDVPSFAVSLGNDLNTISNSITNTNLLTWGGAATGGIIGSFVMPVIGTAIGAGIGALIGSLFGKSLEQYKDESKNMILEVAKQWEKQLAEQIDSSAIQPCYQNVYNTLISAVDGFSKFKPEVERIIREEKRQQECLKDIIKHAQDDLSALKSLVDNSNISFV